MEIADRVAIMDRGKIVQVGTPEEIWKRPGNAFVYDFLGNYNEFLGWKDEEGNTHLCDNHMAIQAEREIAKVSPVFSKPQSLIEKLLNFFGLPRPQVFQDKKTDATSPTTSHQKYVKLFSRPFELVLHKSPEDKESITARVVHVNPAGPLVKLELERESGQIIQAEISTETFKDLDIRKYEKVWITLKDYKIFE